MGGPNIGLAVDFAVDELTAAGMRATSDSAKVNTPGVWVTGRGAEPSTLDGSWDVEVDLILVVPDTNDPRAYKALDKLASQVSDVFNLDESRPLEVTSLTLPNGGKPLPAYRYPTVITTP